MWSWGCLVAAVLLGAALLGPAFWLLLRSTLPPRRFYRPPYRAILWLTPKCQRALGRCASPGKLRGLSLERIACLLARYPDWNERDSDEPPSRRQYSTWREQAELLCAGDYARLRARQRQLLDLALEEGWAGAETLRDDPEEIGEEDWWDGWWRMLTLALSLLLMSLIVWLLFCSSDPEDKTPPVCPVVTGPPCPKPVAAPVREDIFVPADQFFRYNRAEIPAPHAGLLQQQLIDLLSVYSEIKITAIEGYTDPIGTVRSNIGLAQARADAVLAQLKALNPRLPEPARISNLDAVQPKGIGPATGYTATGIWDLCFAEHFQQQPERARSLETISNEVSVSRPRCDAGARPASQSQQYPACRRADFPVDRNERVVETTRSIDKAENFRRLADCLSPLRTVKIRFTAKRLVLPPTPAAAE